VVGDVATRKKIFRRGKPIFECSRKEKGKAGVRRKSGFFNKGREKKGEREC